MFLYCYSYQRKNGSQHNMNTPMMIPRVRAALCSVLQLVLEVLAVGTKNKSKTIKTLFNVIKYTYH